VNPARTVEVIVGPQSADDSEAIKSMARTQAGLDKVRVQISVAGEKANPLEVSELVREAASRHPLALVIEPAVRNDPSLVKAIDEARKQGIPVVLFGRPLEGLPASQPSGAEEKSEGARSVGPLVRVEPESLVAVSNKLIAAAINNAKNAKLDPKGGAVIVVDKAGDSLIDERVRAYHEALKEAGITAIHEVHVTQDTKAARTKLGEFLKTNMKPSLVLATDDPSLAASYQVLGDIIDTHPIVMAGYTSRESSATMSRGGEFAAVAVLPPDRLLRKAVSTAVKAAVGETLPDRVEVLVPVHTSPRDTGLATHYRGYLTPQQQPGREATKKEEPPK
jgi:ABC-type sugar transport system substrate-binding protein